MFQRSEEIDLFERGNEMLKGSDKKEKELNELQDELDSKMKLRKQKIVVILLCSVYILCAVFF